MQHAPALDDAVRARDAAALDALEPLRAVAARHDLGARKSFGQHFLFDLNLTGKIARLAGDLSHAQVIEVGPGPGGLTRALLAAGAAQLIAIEKDARFLDALAEIAAAAPARLHVAQADALHADEAALLAAHGDGVARPALVVANLPYNVGTALLIKWLTAAPVWWTRLVLMFQREVAERIVAQPGEDAYGRLAVLTALRARAELVLSVPARAFTPPPKVESAVVRLEPLGADAFADVETLGAVTAAAFGQRRKMLRRSLKALAAQRGWTVEDWLAVADLPADARPETIPPAGFARLAQFLAQRTA